ncbi:hypothetical protein [Burkholderia sp. 22PA0106]|uniref:DUF7164 domain-containing protein n=1 Tax=Burkholderia sp. 22PA0106 TaxID=3237371 RepID=UPI0039C28E10
MWTTSSQMVEEFSWLFKSVIHSRVLDGGGALIAVCHPDVAGQLPADPRLIVMPEPPHAASHPEWAGYPYINSVANLSRPAVLDACAGFDTVLKTDCDTFVTPALARFEPTALCFGFGAYAYEDSVRRKLVECSARWGFPHSGLHNVGASVLGPSEMVRHFLVAQMEYCNRLLAEEFAQFEGQWPGWCKNVLTMYAGELALRQTYPQQCSLGLLDHFPSAARRLGGDVLHIHAWHTDAYFSKHAFRAGDYTGIDPATIDRGTLAGYCHWLAVAALHEVEPAPALAA